MTDHATTCQRQTQTQSPAQSDRKAVRSSWDRGPLDKHRGPPDGPAGQGPGPTGRARWTGTGAHRTGPLDWDRDPLDAETGARWTPILSRLLSVGSDRSPDPFEECLECS